MDQATYTPEELENEYWFWDDKERLPNLEPVFVPYNPMYIKYASDEVIVSLYN